MISRRRGSKWSVMAALVGVTMLSSVSMASAEPGRGQNLFVQQDEITAFDGFTGQGAQKGTATGAISGTTFVTFELEPTGPPVGDALPISFTNETIITDIDGDQIFFSSSGTGTFHLGVPGSSFLGSGGPLTGISVVTGGTGKYEEWEIGSEYVYRAILTNPPSGGFGNVYTEVSRR